MPLPFDPCCLPLLLGGLPHQGVAPAYDLLRRHAGSLFAWPQLPQRHVREQMIVQSMSGFPGLVVEDQGGQIYIDRQQFRRDVDQLSLAYLENNLQQAALQEDDAHGFAELQRRPDIVTTARALKGQLLGPISLGTQLTDEQQHPLIEDEVLFEALVQHLELRCAWQQSRLGALHGTTIICLDEPFLELVGLPFLPVTWQTAREQLNLVLRRVVGCRGLLGGGDVDWAEALQCQVDLVIANVAQHREALLAATPAVLRFLDRGGIVGLGIVPADSDALERLTPETLVDQVMDLIIQLQAGRFSVDRIIRRCVIAPADTLTQLDPPSAERIVRLVRETSDLLRKQHGLS